MEEKDKTIKYFNNSGTSSFIYSYRPITLYIYEYKHYPYNALNPLVRGLCYHDPKFFHRSHLFQLSEDIDGADFILFPCDLNYFEYRENEVFALLSYFRGNEKKHIFFDDRDQTDVFPSEECICLKVSLDRKKMSRNVFCIPYMDMIDDFFYYYIRKRTIRYDVSFLGQKSEQRQKIIDKLNSTTINVYAKIFDSYFHQKYFNYDTKAPAYSSKQMLKKMRARNKFIQISLSSKFILALMGYGLNSYRFYEALSLGVPPILISENCALPYEDKIDYDSFIIQINANDSELEKKISDIVQTIDDNEYEIMCKLCRFHYDTFFASQKFNYFLHQKLLSLINNTNQGNL